jgi:2-polyprenyl-3-methyl-5-hydroxy-6-metoxy-1,4-benzoquinol methylase
MKKTMNDFYTKGEYFNQTPTWHEEHSPWKAKEIKKMIERNKLQPMSICEVGCGAGRILYELYLELPNNVFFTGYEISPQAYELAKPKSKERLRFYLGDFLEKVDDQFDLLLVIDVIEHVEDYFGFLRGLRDKAKHKIFHIPLDISVQRVLLCKPILRRRREVGHIHYFSKETALATLADTGYEIIDHFYTASTLAFKAKNFIYALGRWPLRLASLLNADMAARILGGHSLVVLAI